MSSSGKQTHYKVDEGGTLVSGPDGVAFLTVHDDGNGVVGFDYKGWDAGPGAPKTIEEADEREMDDDVDDDGGFYWGLSPSDWKEHSKLVSDLIGRRVTLEEGGTKTNWRENNRLAKEIDEGAEMGSLERE